MNIIQLVLMMLLGCLLCDGYPQQTGDPRQYFSQLEHNYVPAAADGKHTYEFLKQLAGNPSPRKPQQTGDPQKYLRQLEHNYIPAMEGKPSPHKPQQTGDPQKYLRQLEHNYIPAMEGKPIHTSQSEHQHEVDESHHENSKRTEAPKVGVLLIQPKHKKVEAMGYQKWDKALIGEESDNTMVLTKIITTSRVEEVFEDLLSEKVRRLIKEDKEVKTQLFRNNVMEEVGSEYIVKNILGGMGES